jgi:GNAT superfamily N-acetyltransferase
MVQPNQSVLPKGYTFAEEIAAQEVIDLRVACEGGKERNPEIWQEAIYTSLLVSGVRGSGNELVGVGFLSGNIRHALLSDLTVHPAHRGHGIGKAIVWHRMDFASKTIEGGIPYIYAEILPTNTLRPFYESLGFVSLARSNMIKRG